MASALYSLWRINIRNLVRNKLFICREWHIQPSEVDKLVFFEYEYMLEDINKDQKDRAEQREKEEKQYADMQRSYKNPMAAAGNYKMPSASNFQLPKFTPPKF